MNRQQISGQDHKIGNLINGLKMWQIKKNWGDTLKIKILFTKK